MRVNRPGEPQGAATARAPVARSASVSVPLLRSVMEQLAEDRRWVVLDLGPARPIMLDLLSDHRVRLDIADLTHEIERAAADPPDDVRRVELPPVRNPEPADIVFCWDLLNYLDRKSLANLMAQVATRCRAGALVHALIVYSERVMSRRPGQLVPTDAGTLSTPAPGGPERAAPRYSPEDLAVAMPDYAVDRVRLLGNGMQEYLFKTRAVRDALNPTPIGAASRTAPRRTPRGSTRGVGK